MTPAGEILAAEIRRGGPLLFSHFMQVALYHPECGYYRHPRDPFGVKGDFFTASQLQPVFGRLIASALGQIRSTLPDADPFRVVEWGAGREEMAPYLSEFNYTAIDVDRGLTPPSFQGVVFCNELFDALPVEVAQVFTSGAVLQRVGLQDGIFTWVDGESPSAEWLEYADTLRPHAQTESFTLELPIHIQPVLERMAAPLQHGAILAIDYGYSNREIVRFPRGTLMSYRRHQAIEDVLLNPGEQDITAHVNFSYVQACARKLGFESESVQTMTAFLMSAGQADQFQSALRAGGEAEASRLRLQLKTLLFGMGESFLCVQLTR